MKLSNKVKALFQLIAFVAAGILGSEALMYVTANVPSETIWNAIRLGCIGGLLYLCYSILLARLEFQDKLEDQNKTVDK